jgi:hypothetical protein
MTKDTSQIREATFGDCQEATELLRDLGLVMPKGEAAIDAHWRRLWIDNPVMMGDGNKPSLGWVLEDQGKMVGFFGNIPLLYYFGERRVIVADASQWGVAKDYRGLTPRLADAYFSQAHVDSLLVTTGIKPTGQLFERYGAHRIPQPEYDRVLYWPVEGSGFVRASLRKKNAPSPLIWALGGIGGLALDIAMGMSRRKPSGAAGSVDVSGVDEIDDSFDALWRLKQGEGEKLLACRSAECLRWHFASQSLAERSQILTFRQGGELKGYAAVVNEEAPNIGLKRLKVVDLLIAGDDGQVLDTLLSRAYVLAKQTGCHVLEVIGLPAALRVQVHRHRPLIRSMPTWPLYYKACNDYLTGVLGQEAAWYVTPYDGDTSLF